MQVSWKSQLTTNAPRVGRVSTPAGEARLKPNERTSLVAENGDGCRARGRCSPPSASHVVAKVAFEPTARRELLKRGSPRSCTYERRDAWPPLVDLAPARSSGARPVPCLGRVRCTRRAQARALPDRTGPPAPARTRAVLSRFPFGFDGSWFLCASDPPANARGQCAGPAAWTS